MFRVCISLHKRRRCAQPDSTQNKLEKGSDWNNYFGCSRKQQPFHLSSWDSDPEDKNYSNGFSQNSGYCQSEHNSESDLL